MAYKPKFEPSDHFVTSYYLASGVASYETPNGGEGVQEHLFTGQLEMIESLEPYGKVLDDVFNELAIDGGFPGVAAYDIAEDRMARKLSEYAVSENSLPDLDEFKAWSYEVIQQWCEEKTPPTHCIA